jgi:hypothetical protein
VEYRAINLSSALDRSGFDLAHSSL